FRGARLVARGALRRARRDVRGARLALAHACALRDPRDRARAFSARAAPGTGGLVAERLEPGDRRGTGTEGGSEPAGRPLARAEAGPGPRTGAGACPRDRVRDCPLAPVRTGPRRRALPPRARTQARRARLALAARGRRVPGRRASPRLRVPALARVPGARRPARRGRPRERRPARVVAPRSRSLSGHLRGWPGSLSLGGARLGRARRDPRARGARRGQRRVAPGAQPAGDRGAVSPSGGRARARLLGPAAAARLARP